MKQAKAEEYATDQEVYRFIVQFSNQRGYAPSLKEIAKALKISSTSTVNYAVQKLVDQGLIKREDKIARGMTLVGSTTSAERALIEAWYRLRLNEPTAEQLFGAEFVCRRLCQELGLSWTKIRDHVASVLELEGRSAA